MKMTTEEPPVNIILPSNREMDVTFEFSEKPKLYDYFLYMDFNKNGSCLLGSSDLSGTFWEGNVLYFKEPQSFLQLNYSKYHINHTASNGKFLNDDMIAIAEDNGNIKILAIDDSSTLKPANIFRHHRRVNEIDVWDHYNQILSAAGRQITIWNSDLQKSVFSSENIHCDTINSVSTFKSTLGMFVSASSDRKACLWDIRTEATPIVLYSNEFSALTRITTNSQDLNYVALGTQSGDVYLIDKRHPGDFVATFSCFKSPISSLSFDHRQHLAVAGDTNKVLVLDIKNFGKNNQLKAVYQNLSHKGHVKCVKWFNGTLYSCGFGSRQIMKHNIDK